MSKEMIISVNGREKKIAILDNGKVTEFYIERGDEENSGIAGNIYKGRVQRVLPGMQSAFVSIGLERDAFLYVSDFFDEEEEIERIVMEKSKKGSQEDAKREANERIDRARIEREKQMDSAQELTEPLIEKDDSEPEIETETVVEDRSPKPDRDRGRRGRRDRVEEAHDRYANAKKEEKVEREPLFEIEDSGFERIIDDSETGEMFKDAFMQEAIVDKVRAVEFDMESIDEAPVGSLLTDVTSDAGGFERIADDDDAPAEKPKRGAKGKAASRSKKSDGDALEEKPLAKPKKPSATKKKAASTRARSKKAAAAESGDAQLADQQASVKESSDNAEMSVRRGGRGRRRGGRGKKAEDGTESIDQLEASDEITPLGFDDGEEEGSTDTVALESDESQPSASEPETESKDERDESQPKPDRGRRDQRPNQPRERGGRGRENQGPREARNDRPEQGNRNDRPERNDRDRNDRGDRRDRPAQPTISDLLREGQEILVQIAKEPIAKKGARITSHIALPGRFLVYMPTIEHLGVSRKIESASERSRLRTLIQRIRQDEEIPSGGFIVRTAGIGISEEDLRQDARYLVRTWQDIRKTSEKAKSPAMVHQDLDLVQRLLRDQLSDNFTAIRVDSEDEYLRTVEFINRIQPRLVNRVKFYTREQPILDAYNVQEEIDKALKPRVWLKSGGYLVINQTEALVAIDVNTGKFVGKGNARLEDTITRTNMEAVDEIARQIRLRDLGGIIVLDLIDMEDRRNRHKVSQALQEALSTDRSPTKVLSFNDFGLIIMTRKRVKQSLERTMCAPCDYCEGAGWVKSPTTIAYEILSEASRLAKHLDDVRQTTLRVHPEVAKTLRSSEKEVFEEIEAHLGNVDLTADPHIHQAQFDFAFI
jgi:ribonuclease G